MSTNNVNSYEISIKFVLLYNNRLLLPKYFLLVRTVCISDCDHNLDHVLVICGLCFLHGAKRQVDRLV